MSRVLPLFVALPIAAASVTALARRHPRRRRVVVLVTFGVLLALAIALVVVTADGRIVVSQIGGWPPPFAIPFVGDLLASLMLVVSYLMIIVCYLFAVARREDEHPFYASLVLVLSAGVAGAFLTGDIFNLFVFFEVMLIASYVLLSLDGTPLQVRAGAVYVTTNLLASTVLVAGVALTYGAAGTVNIAALGQLAADSTTILVATGLLLVAFSVKASVVPVHGWLPRSYPAAPPAVAALFSGLLSKVGVYALYRLYTVVFAGDPSFRSLFLVVASVTMVVGVLGAVGREGIREILSFHMVSQIGYILLGIGLFGALGLAAGIFYMLQYIVVKTSLFLTAGAVETTKGTGTLARLGGVAREQPLLALAFVISALSLAGIPPLSGFFAKVALVRASFSLGEFGAGAVAVIVSFFTLLSMIKIYDGVFADKVAAGAPAAPMAPAATIADLSGGRRVALAIPGLFLAAVTVGVGFGAEGLLALSHRAAEVLVDPSLYVRAVLGL